MVWVLECLRIELLAGRGVTICRRGDREIGGSELAEALFFV